jgi:cbb3-type cytochrome c oxidase subunit III
MSRHRRALILLPFCAALSACRQDMHDQPRYDPLQESTFFADGRSARPYIEGTVARGQLNSDTVFYTGKRGDQFVDTLPFPLTRDVLNRGRERFTIYCTPCHGQTGEGNGMIVQRGFSHPPLYTSERVRTQPLGHYFDVITNGFGAMHSYAARVAPRDRWAIAAYIRVLQVSRSATVNDVPPDKRSSLDEEKQ